jgi:Rieske 2Fe-2S family protein
MSVSYVHDRPERVAGAFTLPARYYTDPALFEREMEAIHYRSWLFAGRADELPGPGSFVRRQFGRADVLVVRGDDATVRAFHNSCRHRGTLLCAEREGRFSGSIQCRYHAWTYGLDGALRAAPHMDRVRDFREQDYPLVGLQVAEWDGNLFVNLSQTPSPFAEHLAGLDQRFRPYRMRELRRGARRVYRVEANWKLVIQNYSECLHCPIAHPQLGKLSHYLSGDNEAPQPSYLGGRMELKDGIASMTMDGSSNRACFAELSEADRRSVHYYALLPNLLLNLHPDYVMTYALWPLAVDRTEIVCDWHFHPGEMAKPDFEPEGAVEFWDVTNRQDWLLSDLAQKGIGSLGYRQGPFSYREDLLPALDRWLLARLGETR